MKSKKYKLSAIVFYLVIMTLALGLPNVAFASTIQLPKTGQTKCYDTSSAEIPCAGTGQDGDIQAGVAWPSPRFTDNGDGTVTDNLTGLMWKKDANLSGGAMTWQQALDYVKTVNVGGHIDWRLPNVNELKSLVDYSQCNPSLPLGHPFTNIVQSYNSYYWSSTTHAYHTDCAWVVSMYDGSVNHGIKAGLSYYAWPVRGGQCGSLGNSVICPPKTGQNKCYDTNGNQIPCAGTGQDGDIQTGVAWPSPRFTVNENDTVTDNLTGLMWTQNANPAGYFIRSWQKALDYVKTLNTGGHTDWRLPNVNELVSLLNDNEPDAATWLKSQGFTNGQSYYCYWLSTNYAVYPGGAWYIDILDGSVSHNDKTANFGYAWAVRGSGSISTTTTVPANQCIAETLYGEQSDETELLREYRDKVLRKSATGRQMIKTYYDLSPAVSEVLQNNDTARSRARRVLDSLMPAIREKVKQ